MCKLRRTDIAKRSNLMSSSFAILESILFLKKNPLFSSMNTQELKAVASICQSLDFNEGDEIVKQGDVGETMFLIKSGKVDVTHTKGGKSLKLATLDAGESFGEMSMFDTEMRSATVSAASNCSLIAIDGKELNDILNSYPEIGVAIIKTFVKRLRAGNKKLQELSQ